jgi:hypothetical protein
VFSSKRKTKSLNPMMSLTTSLMTISKSSMWALLECPNVFYSLVFSQVELRMMVNSMKTTNFAFVGVEELLCLIPSHPSAYGRESAAPAAA